jgi:predicted NBD/HSP70 family sugar kinase
MPGGGTAAGGTAGGGTAEGAALTTALISRIADLRKAMAEMGHHRLLAVAIGVSGMVDTSRGEILLSRTLGIRRPTPIGAPVQDAVGVPVWIFNDADASAIGELEYGRREGDRGEAAPSEEAGRYGQGADPAAARDLLFVLVRYKAPPRLADARLNAGLGIVLDERLREAYAGGGREFRSPFVDARSSEQFAVAERTRRGEFAIRRELEAAFADELGLAVSFLVHALDLRNVVLGGDVLRDGVPYEVFDAAIRHHVSSSTARIEPQPLELRRPVAGDRAVAFGAAAAAVRRLFRHRLFPLDTDAPLVREKV